MNGLPPPKLLRTEQTDQLRYELPHRIYCTAYHPSNAIVYGNENGVRILWRERGPDEHSLLDLNFGQTIQIAVLPTQQIIFAAACTDAVRLVTLPNTVITLSTSAANAVAITLADKYILVASHSRAVTGILQLHRIPFSIKDGVYTFSEHTSQTHYLSSPAKSLSFSTTLLVVDDNACRLFADTWLLTIYPRKTIIDAKWLQGGKAIIALLADGEWGIWELEPGSKGILGQSIKGGAYTPFTLSGYIEAPSTKARAATTSINSSKFTPMTPSTRKTAPDALFSPRSASSGAIAVSSLPKPSSTQVPDEAIALWLDTSFALIPSLRAFHETQNRRGGAGALFGSGHNSSRTTRLEGVRLGGEHCSAIALGAPTASRAIPIEVIIAAEHRFLVLSDATTTDMQAAARGALMPRVNRGEGLMTGALGVDEIDQELDRMEESGSEAVAVGAGVKRKITFARS